MPKTLEQALADYLGYKTAIVDEAGQPKTFFHGTSVPYEEIDTSKLSKSALLGPGYYMSDSPEITGGQFEDTTRWTFHSSREEAMKQPGREGFVWKGEASNIPPDRPWIALVKDYKLAKPGYAHKGNLFVSKKDAERLVERIRSEGQHWKTPGYLTASEREEVSNALDHFLMWGGEKGHLLSVLESSLNAQPYNIDVLNTAHHMGMVSGPNVRPAYVGSKRPLDLRTWDTIPDKEQFAREFAGLANKRSIADFVEQVRSGAMIQSPQQMLLGDWPGAASGSPEMTTTKARAHGFDTVVHEGGIWGGKPHTVVIATEPKQVVPKYAKGLIASMLASILLAMTMQSMGQGDKQSA